MTAYSEIAAVNFSTLKHMESGPLHYRAGIARKFKTSEPMKLGSAGHCLVFEPDQFNARYCINDWNRNSTKFKELVMMEAEAGRELIKTKTETAASHITENVLGHHEASVLIAESLHEQTLTWDMHGFACKGRLDGLILKPSPVLVKLLKMKKSRPIILDLKTTADPQPRKFSRQVYDMKYYSQMAFYAAGMVAVHGCEYPETYLIAVGNKEPYECIVYNLPLPVMDAGEGMYIKWLDDLRACKVADVYRSKFEGIQKLELPAYAVGSEAETSLIIDGQEVVL